MVDGTLPCNIHPLTWSVFVATQAEWSTPMPVSSGNQPLSKLMLLLQPQKQPASFFQLMRQYEIRSLRALMVKEALEEECQDVAEAVEEAEACDDDHNSIMPSVHGRLYVTSGYYSQYAISQ